MSEIFGNLRFGTIITLRGRRYFDFVLRVDIMTKGKGSVGIVFRMVDPFNYFAFEFNIEYSYKQLVKVKNGVKHVLLNIPDGGITLNNWFKVLIQAETNRFIIRAGDSKKYSNYQAAPIIFNFLDDSFPKGE